MVTIKNKKDNHKLKVSKNAYEIMYKRMGYEIEKGKITNSAPKTKAKGNEATSAVSAPKADGKK